MNRRGPVPGRTHAHQSRAVLGLGVGGEDRSFDATAVVEQPRNGAVYPYSIRQRPSRRLQQLPTPTHPSQRRPAPPPERAAGGPRVCTHWHWHPPSRRPAAPSAALIRPHCNLGHGHVLCPPQPTTAHRNPLPLCARPSYVTPPLPAQVACSSHFLELCTDSTCLRRQAETNRARNPSYTLASRCAWRNFRLPYPSAQVGAVPLTWGLAVDYLPLLYRPRIAKYKC